MNLGRLNMDKSDLLDIFLLRNMHKPNPEHGRQLTTSCAQKKGRAGADRGGGGARALQEVAAPRGEVEVQLEEVLREKKAARQVCQGRDQEALKAASA